MKFELRFPVFLLVVFATACNLPSTSGQKILDQPPTPSPDTPAPAGIDAALVNAPQLTSIHMLDELNGWGITESAVVRTNDGGATWYNLTPSGLTEAGYAVNGFFLDSSHAWIILADQNDYQHAGTLYRTQDGGLDWTSDPVPFGGGHLAFLDSSNGWMLADLGVGAGSNAVAVYQTTDGGSSWIRTYINDPTVEGAGDSLPLGGLKYGLVPRDMKTAWIGGVIYAPGTVYLYRTDDAGHTWEPISLTLPADTENSELGFADLQFVSASDAYLTMHISGDNYQLSVYISKDGGDSWSLMPTLIPNGGSVDFVSAGEGVVWNGTRFYLTRDAARTWKSVSPDILFGDTFAQMDFVNPDVGWVITYDSSARYNLYKTTDSGATWTALFPQE